MFKLRSKEGDGSVSLTGDILLNVRMPGEVEEGGGHQPQLHQGPAVLLVESGPTGGVQQQEGKGSRERVSDELEDLADVLVHTEGALQDPAVREPHPE